MVSHFPEAAPGAHVVLASASPRRKELLEAAGISCIVVPTNVPEVPRDGESPEQFVRRVAAEKAATALDQMPQPCSLPILGADTVVVLGEQILGKPASAEDARRMLQQLSGQEHRVLTGLCLLYPPRRGPLAKEDLARDIQVASTKVKFAKLAPEEIAAYVATGEPFDKAGAYAIQGQASKFVERIEGCYFNVVGLPVALLYEMLKRCG